MWLSRVCLALAVTLAATGVRAVGQQPRPRAGEAEASANFDGEDIAPVLGRLSALISAGFTRDDAHKLASLIAAQAAQTTRTYEYQVQRAGQKMSLRVVVIKEDPDASDVYFFSMPALTTALDHEIEAYMKSVNK